jgi:hypothetical protein
MHTYHGVVEGVVLERFDRNDDNLRQDEGSLTSSSENVTFLVGIRSFVLCRSARNSDKLVLRTYFFSFLKSSPIIRIEAGILVKSLGFRVTLLLFTWTM